MRWYYYLNNKKERNLISGEQIDDDTLIIGNWASQKRYTTFKNHISFLDYSESTIPEDRCFFEIILENMRRKMYFDVDMNKDQLSLDFSEIDFVKHTLDAIRAVINESGEQKQPTILTFTSHTDKKKSYHFIVDRFYLQNHEECITFFNRTIEKIDDEFIPYFDSSVYKKTQQFRVVGSHKWQRENVKRLNKKLSYNLKIPGRFETIKGEKLYILLHSLVGKVIGCDYLMGFTPEKTIRKCIEGDSSEHDFDEVMKFVKEYRQWQKGNFEIGDVVEENGNLIIPCRSLSGYWCYGCKRTHEAENPYIGVMGINREIIFDCRRGSRQFIGKLGKRVTSSQEEQVPYGIELPVQDKEGLLPKQDEDVTLFKMKASPVPLQSRKSRLDRLTRVKCDQEYVPKVNLDVDIKLY